MELWRAALYAAILLLAVQTVQSREHRAPRSSLELKADLRTLLGPLNDPRVEPDIDVLCVLEHCIPESVECLINSGCRDAIGCVAGCLSNWDKDNTTEKFHVQNCTNECSFTYEDKNYDNFMACMTSKKCMTLPPIPNTCRSPDPGVHPLKNLGTKDMEGSWWVIRGHHPVYDCYPCQQVIISPINASAWLYTPEYETYLVNGSVKYITYQHWVMPNSPPGQSIPFVYYDTGLVHYETWWLIDKADDGSYILMYYCGHTLQWYYEGSLVMAKSQSIPEAEYKTIAAAYEKAVGLDATKFCHVRLTNCPQKRE